VTLFVSTLVSYFLSFHFLLSLSSCSECVSKKRFPLDTPGSSCFDENQLSVSLEGIWSE
jgi:hypothetical protein